jgi:tetratricopeptide (TPR) repeat protein
MLKHLRIYLKLKARRFSEVLLLLPNDNEISPAKLLYRAHCNFKLKQYGIAERDYEKLKEIKSYSYFAYNNLGYLYLEQLQFDKAIVELEKARILEPKQSFALNNLGFAYMMTGRIDQGLKMVEDALKLDRHNYYAMRNIGVYYLLQNQFSQALVVFEKARTKDKFIDDIDNYILICHYKIENKQNMDEFRLKLPSSEIARFDMILKAFS